MAVFKAMSFWNGSMLMCGANDGGATEVDAPLSHRMRCGFNHADGMSRRDAVSRWSRMCSNSRKLMS